MGMVRSASCGGARDERSEALFPMGWVCAPCARACARARPCHWPLVRAPGRGQLLLRTGADAPAIALCPRTTALCLGTGSHGTHALTRLLAFSPARIADRRLGVIAGASCIVHRRCVVRHGAAHVSPPPLRAALSGPVRLAATQRSATRSARAAPPAHRLAPCVTAAVASTGTRTGTRLRAHSYAVRRTPYRPVHACSCPCSCMHCGGSSEQRSSGPGPAPQRGSVRCSALSNSSVAEDACCMEWKARHRYPSHPQAASWTSTARWGAGTAAKPRPRAACVECREPLVELVMGVMDVELRPDQVGSPGLCDVLRLGLPLGGLLRAAIRA